MIELRHLLDQATDAIKDGRMQMAYNTIENLRRLLIAPHEQTVSALNARIAELSGALRTAIAHIDPDNRAPGLQLTNREMRNKLRSVLSGDAA